MKKEIDCNECKESFTAYAEYEVHYYTYKKNNMKREFKFRVWDSMYLNWKNPEDYTYTELFLDDKYIVQQFTGMVDKNGVEIYEGDIIKYPIPVGWSTNSLHRENYRVDEVKFVTGCFIPDIWRTVVDDCEVIGNVFEKDKI